MKNQDKESVLPEQGCAFPDRIPFKLLGSAIDEAENNIKSPRPILFSAALGAISLSLQGFFDVQRPKGLLSPLSLMIMVVAESGERKSTSDGIFMRGIRDFQEREIKNYIDKLKSYNSLFKAWEVKQKYLLRSIGKAAARGEPSAEDEIRLLEISEMEPDKPREVRIIYDDVTVEALFLGMYKNIRSAGLVSGEGGGILNGRTMRGLDKINKIWSGEAITVNRATAESYELNDARLTVSIMLQESALTKYMSRNSEESRGSGLWARFLVCSPKSTQGERVIDGGFLSWSNCDIFSDRIIELLSKGDPEFFGAKKKEIITFSPAAERLWIQAFNEIELGIKPGGRFCKAADHASKLAENIARVAALLELFEHGSRVISRETMEFSIRVCMWYSDEFKRLFVFPSQSELDVEALNKWIDGKLKDGHREVSKNEILQYGPGRIRKKDRLNDAIVTLCNKGKISTYTYKGKEFVRFRPSGRAQSTRLDNTDSVPRCVPIGT